MQVSVGRALALPRTDNFSHGELLNLHLILPGTTLDSLLCKAQVLSVGQTTKKGRKTALKIVHIMPEDSEKVFFIYSGRTLQKHAG